MIRDSKTFCFNSDWPKGINNNLKHEIEFIIRNNESLAANIIKNQIEQLLNTENSKVRSQTKKFR